MAAAVYWYGDGSLGRPFCTGGVEKLEIHNGRLHDKKYIKILENHLVSFALAEHGTNQGDFMFMNDGAAENSANIVKQWFMDMGIILMNWHSCSPDIN